MSVDDKLLELNNRLIRWTKGHPFSPEFDQWCQLSSPSPVKFTSPTSLNDFQKAHADSEGQPIPQEYIRAITTEGKRWMTLILDLENRHTDKEWIFEFPVLGRSGDPIAAENTHVWNFDFKNTLGWITGNLQFINLRARFLRLDLRGSKNPIRFVNCVIGSLTFPDLAVKSGEKLSVELYDCLIGTLKLHSKSLKNLTVTSGGIAQIGCPSSDSENPFTGAVSFKNVFFPSSPRQTKLFQSPHAYRSLYAHLKKLDNTLMANQMRSHQLRAERADEHGLARFTNWIYGTFANYGMNPGRPIWLLLGLYALTFVYIYNFDGGTQAQTDGLYKGTHASLLDENDGRLHRSIQLPLQLIVNPFSMFDPRKLIVPTTTFGSWLLTLQGLFSDILLVMTALSIRRRFKAE